MSNPRFQPNSYLSDPAVFGRAAVVDWVESPENPSSSWRDQFGASQRQHSLAYAIRTQAKRRFGSIKAYTDAFELNYQRISAVLRGDQIMRLEDIVNAERNLKVGQAMSAVSPDAKSSPSVRPSDR